MRAREAASFWTSVILANLLDYFCISMRSPWSNTKIFSKRYYHSHQAVYSCITLMNISSRVSLPVTSFSDGLLPFHNNCPVILNWVTNRDLWILTRVRVRVRDFLNTRWWARVNQRHLAGKRCSRGARSLQPKFRPVRPGKVVHLKRWTSFFETFPVGPNRSIEFWTEISGNFGWMDRSRGLSTTSLARMSWWR